MCRAPTSLVFGQNDEHAEEVKKAHTLHIRYEDFGAGAGKKRRISTLLGH